MTEESRVDATGRRIVRRRRKSRSQNRTGPRYWLRGQQAARILLGAMIVTTIAYAALVAQSAYSASKSYGNISIGMADDAVIAVLGQPTTREGPARWIFDNNGEVTSIGFDSQNRVVEVSCTELHETLERCPTTLGLDVGTNERDLKLKIGAPHTETASGHAKTLHYPEVGLTFFLQRGEVVRIQFASASQPSRLARLIGWMLIP